jgi:hypothetical protein
MEAIADLEEAISAKRRDLAKANQLRAKQGLHIAAGAADEVLLRAAVSSSVSAATRVEHDTEKRIIRLPSVDVSDAMQPEASLLYPAVQPLPSEFERIVRATEEWTHDARTAVIDGKFSKLATTDDSADRDRMNALCGGGLGPLRQLAGEIALAARKSLSPLTISRNVCIGLAYVILFDGDEYRSNSALNTFCAMLQVRAPSVHEALSGPAAVVDGGPMVGVQSGNNLFQSLWGLPPSLQQQFANVPLQGSSLPDAPWPVRPAWVPSCADWISSLWLSGFRRRWFGASCGQGESSLQGCPDEFVTLNDQKKAERYRDRVMSDPLERDTGDVMRSAASEDVASPTPSPSRAPKRPREEGGDAVPLRPAFPIDPTVYELPHVLRDDQLFRLCKAVFSRVGEPLNATLAHDAEKRKTGLDDTMLKSTLPMVWSDLDGAAWASRHRVPEASVRLTRLNPNLGRFTRLLCRCISFFCGAQQASVREHALYPTEELHALLFIAMRALIDPTVGESLDLHDALRDLIRTVVCELDRRSSVEDSSVSYLAEFFDRFQALWLCCAFAGPLPSAAKNQLAADAHRYSRTRIAPGSPPRLSAKGHSKVLVHSGVQGDEKILEETYGKVLKHRGKAAERTYVELFTKSPGSDWSWRWGCLEEWFPPSGTHTHPDVVVGGLGSVQESTRPSEVFRVRFLDEPERVYYLDLERFFVQVAPAPTQRLRAELQMLAPQERIKELSFEWQSVGVHMLRHPFSFNFQVLLSRLPGDRLSEPPAMLRFRGCVAHAVLENMLCSGDSRVFRRHLQRKRKRMLDERKVAAAEARGLAAPPEKKQTLISDHLVKGQEKALEQEEEDIQEVFGEHRWVTPFEIENLGAPDAVRTKALLIPPLPPVLSLFSTWTTDKLEQGHFYRLNVLVSLVQAAALATWRADPIPPDTSGLVSATATPWVRPQALATAQWLQQVCAAGDDAGLEDSPVKLFLAASRVTGPKDMVRELSTLVTGWMGATKVYRSAYVEAMQLDAMLLSFRERLEAVNPAFL